MGKLPTAATIPQLCHKEEAYRQLLQHQKQQWLNAYRRKIIWRKRTIKTKSRFVRLMPGIMITLGSVILANALWPVVSYFAFTSPQLQKAQLISARGQNTFVEQTKETTTGTALANEFKPKIIYQELDYTNLNSWFPDSELPVVNASSSEKQNQVDEYTLNIPSLGIESAKVKIGGLNLDDNLIQYPGTADPGQEGAPVIFGHSVLRQFYNPSLKNTRRYLSIFSTIMTMKNGDEIEIEYDGIKYIYSVIDKVEVKPEDMFILEQNTSGKYLKLITCVPEGTYLRRGVVIAQLEKTQ